ncbi:MAG: DUF3098 domain-containing protein [Bacteroidales bacterium]|nr:DUF3098 domain-containing protein [Bacteroidales bacterium]MCL2739300.1 DUF3098 domain-containing protein [Bacteroidales bacterium]
MNKQAVGTNKEQVQEQRFAVSRKNVVWILAGFGLMILGYILMIGGGTKDPNVFTGEAMFSFRRIVLAPVLIFIGFVFEVWAIMHIAKSK